MLAMTTKKLICSLVLLLATLSGACGQADPNSCPCPPARPCDGWNCSPCIAPGCPRCLFYGYCDVDDPPPAPVNTYDGFSLLAFGDSFADNGNSPKTATSDVDHVLVRAWYTPYGHSYGNDDGSYNPNTKQTGRYSNYMVQSDFVAKMLGLDMAPPPYKMQQNQPYDVTGMTYATAGSGVYSVPPGVPTLSDQVASFESHINEGLISPERLAKSVALVAVSGNDYDRVGVAVPTGFGDVSAFVRNVTSAIAASVDRLTALGVPKVLVNNLHPVGCTPAQTRATNHSGCDAAGNTGAATHNENLARLMKDKQGVLVVDLHSAFKGIIDGQNHFKNKLSPCCQGIDSTYLCADTSADGPLYSLCSNPRERFYWDEMHPTQTGWAAVMAQVEGDIKQFVGVA